MLNAIYIFRACWNTDINNVDFFYSILHSYFCQRFSQGNNIFKNMQLANILLTSFWQISQNVEQLCFVIELQSFII